MVVHWTGSNSAVIIIDFSSPEIFGSQAVYTDVEVVGHEVAEAALLMWNPSMGYDGAHSLAVAYVDDPVLAAEGYTSRVSRSTNGVYAAPSRLTPSGGR